MVVLDRVTWLDVENDSKELEKWISQWTKPGIVTCYEYQRRAAAMGTRPILNAACGPDPAGLGISFAATNMDMYAIDAMTGQHFGRNANFVLGSVFEIPFPDQSYGTVVLGEFLEHCTFDAARKAVLEARRVLFPEGLLILTVPLDGRPVDEQRILDKDREKPQKAWEEGVTNFHQTWWSNRMLFNLADFCGFEEISRIPLVYALTAPISGWGMTWKKRPG